VRDSQNQNHAALIVNPAHDPVCADAVPPKAYFVSRQGFARASRVTVARDPILQKAYDAPLPGSIKLLKLA
jgi:hypothetical protein